MSAKQLSIVVLISGRGSNLKAILDAENPLLNVRAVISNRPQAAGFAYADAYRIPMIRFDHQAFPDRNSFDKTLQATIDGYQPDLVVLAGFMLILSSSFVKHYHGRMINIHPSLLPAFKGRNTHERALAAGAAQHGASVHFVTEELDSGPVIAQAKVPVLPTDTPARLAERVLAEEHRLYPKVLRWFTEGWVSLQGNQVVMLRD